jgi:transposase-like protein
MEKRQWDAKTKTRIVLEGLRGRPVGELCNEYQISQAQYYQWHKRFLAEAYKVFETKQQNQKETRLWRENARLKSLVGELSLELKKIDGDLG